MSTSVPSVTPDNCKTTNSYLLEKQRKGERPTGHERVLESLERARHQGSTGQQQQTPSEISQVLRAETLRGGLRYLDGTSSDMAGMTDGQKEAVHNAMHQIPAWSLISELPSPDLSSTPSNAALGGETRASLTASELVRMQPSLAVGTWLTMPRTPRQPRLSVPCLRSSARRRWTA